MIDVTQLISKKRLHKFDVHPVNSQRLRFAILLNT